MATFDYNKSADKALELITKFGGDAQLVVNASVSDSEEPWKAVTPVWSYHDTQAVKVPVSSKDVVFLPDGTSLSTTYKVLMETVKMTNTPTLGDKVKINSVEYLIIAIKPLNPADINVLWTLFVKV